MILNVMEAKSPQSAWKKIPFTTEFLNTNTFTKVNPNLISWPKTKSLLSEIPCEDICEGVSFEALLKYHLLYEPSPHKKQRKDTRW